MWTALFTNSSLQRRQECYNKEEITKRGPDKRLLSMAKTIMIDELNEEKNNYIS